MLAALPAHQLRRLRERLEPVELAFGDILVEDAAIVRYVYFPNDCVVSLLAVADSRSGVEVGRVGSEGMVGITFALGRDSSPVRALVQVAGSALRMAALPFRNEFRSSSSLQRAVHQGSLSLLSQVVRVAACNRFHVVEARLAHSLLSTRDRLRSDHFHLTHETLAQVLGVRRAGVTTAAHALKERGLIEYTRGAIEILDGAALEKASCSCYRALRPS